MDKPSVDREVEFGQSTCGKRALSAVPACGRSPIVQAMATLTGVSYVEVAPGENVYSGSVKTANESSVTGQSHIPTALTRNRRLPFGYSAPFIGFVLGVCISVLSAASGVDETIAAMKRMMYRLTSGMFTIPCLKDVHFRLATAKVVHAGAEFPACSADLEYGRHVS